MFGGSHFVRVLFCAVISWFFSFYCCLVEPASERLRFNCFAFFLFLNVFSVFYIAVSGWASTAGWVGIFSSWKRQCAYFSVGGGEVFGLGLGTRQTNMASTGQTVQ